jgi:hypothetical protein
MSSLKDITDADAIDHFMLYCSLDSWGTQAEYIRNGLEFETLYKNVTDYLRNSRKHSLTFIVTFNVLSYTGFFEYIKNIHQMRKEYNTNRQLIWFDIPMLNDPMWMNPKLIPELTTELEKSIKYMNDNKETMFNRFKGFKDFEVSKVQRLIDWINNPAGFDRTLSMKNFYLYFTEQDKRRGTNFINVFPQLTNFWNECKDLNGS